MNGSMTTTRRLMGLLLAACSVGFSASAADIDGVRVWAGPDKTRAVLDLSSEVDYRVFSLDNPRRVVVDVKNASLGPSTSIPSVGGDVLTDIRTGRRNESDLRIVFDLGMDASPRSFLLEPAANYGHRLVIDLFPKQQLAEPAPVRRAPVAPAEDRDIIIALDAGHGGEDPGAIGKGGNYEKDVVLAIAREVEKIIDATPGFQAELTRTGDYYIKLSERPERAREKQADIFVSIHADAFYDRRVRGSSVFVLSRRRASSEAARWLADRENRADLVGGVKLEDKDDTLAAVLLDLSQSASMEASLTAANAVFQSLEQVGKTHKRHVESANFGMLISPDIPSLLVETGFISNPDEERRLTSSEGRAEIALAISEGLFNYFYATPPPGTWVAANRTRTPLRHTVSRGETLSEIARAHNVSLGRLRHANGINGDLVRVGDVLTVPTI